MSHSEKHYYYLGVLVGMVSGIIFMLIAYFPDRPLHLFISIIVFASLLLTPIAGFVNHRAKIDANQDAKEAE